MKQSVECSSSCATLSINGSLKTFHCALGFSYSLYCYYFVPLLRILKFGQVLHPRALKYSGIYPGLSSSPFHCYNCVVRKSKAYYPMNLEFYFPQKNQSWFEKQNEAIEAKYLIFQRINGKVLSVQNQHFSSNPSDRSTLNFTNIKA